MLHIYYQLIFPYDEFPNPDRLVGHYTHLGGKKCINLKNRKDFLLNIKNLDLLNHVKY